MLLSGSNKVKNHSLHHNNNNNNNNNNSLQVRRLVYFDQLIPDQGKMVECDLSNYLKSCYKENSSIMVVWRSMTMVGRWARI
jgi:hypothetical protein